MLCCYQFNVNYNKILMHIFKWNSKFKRQFIENNEYLFSFDTIDLQHKQIIYFIHNFPHLVIRHLHILSLYNS